MSASYICIKYQYFCIKNIFFLSHKGTKKKYFYLYIPYMKYKDKLQ